MRRTTSTDRPGPLDAGQTAGSLSTRPGNGLPVAVLLRCFLRSLFLQASWNSRGMQNLGFLYAIEPALSFLYPDPAKKAEAVQRHLEPFNTQPYLAEAILGGAIHHESSVAMGLVGEDRVTSFKRALAGPFAALGDTFFWAGLRPATAALSVALVPFLGAWAILVFLVLYNWVHLGSRVFLFRAGLRLGDGVLDAVGSLELAHRAQRLKRASAALGAVATLVLVTTLARELGYPMPGALMALAVGGALLVPLIYRMRFPYPLLFVLAVLGALLGVIGAGGAG